MISFLAMGRLSLFAVLLAAACSSKVSSLGFSEPDGQSLTAPPDAADVVHLSDVEAGTTSGGAGGFADAAPSEDAAPVEASAEDAGAEDAASVPDAAADAAPLVCVGVECLPCPGYAACCNNQNRCSCLVFGSCLPSSP